MNSKQNALVNDLRDRGVPAEWAILIAKRNNSQTSPIGDKETVSGFVACAFVWNSSPEGSLFWNGAYHAIADELGESNSACFEYMEEEFSYGR